MQKIKMSVWRSLPVFCLFLMVAVACDEEMSGSSEVTSFNDTVLPVIVMAGNKNDTAYLFSTYRDPGASVFDDQDGVYSCMDYWPVTEVTGWVNTRLPGNYYLKYDYKGEDGRLIASATRTVCVKENAAGFLNGIYNVTCTCSAITGSVNQPTVSSFNYTTTVFSNHVNKGFKIGAMRIGTEEISPDAVLDGSLIRIGYFSPDYHCASSMSGTLSPSTTSFTTDSRFYRYSPSVVYTCKNLYKQQLVLTRSVASNRSADDN